MAGPPKNGPPKNGPPKNGPPKNGPPKNGPPKNGPPNNGPPNNGPPNNGLSEQDLDTARTDLSAGRPVTVWFTAAAVGVAAGGSAKVVSVGEVAEGDHIQVRPTGSRDTMFCSPGELTRSRPPRKPAPPPARRAAGQPVAGSPAPPDPEKDAEVAKPRGSTPVPPASVAGPPEERGPGRPRSGGGRAGVPAEVSVTLNATGDGEWTVEVTVGRKRTVRPTPVQPGDVATAARALPPAVAEAIASSLDAARRRRLEQVERLRAELDAAERALKELNG